MSEPPEPSMNEADEEPMRRLQEHLDASEEKALATLAAICDQLAHRNRQETFVQSGNNAERCCGGCRICLGFGFFARVQKRDRFDSSRIQKI